MNFILLAAGHGQRMGGNKALINLNGVPWILIQLRQIADAGLEKITVVTNPSSEMALVKIIADFKPKVSLITNPQTEKGPFSSLQRALAATHDEVSFVCPVDVPLRTSTLKDLRQAWLLQQRPLDALIPSYKGQKGHPVVLSTELQRALLELPQDRPEARLDFALRTLPEDKKKILELEDPNITLNLNSTEDLAAFTSPI